MPHKDPEARRAYQKARMEKIRAENPDWVAKQAAKSSEYHKKKQAEDEKYREKRKADYERWYAEHGKDNARDRKGYIPWEEYLSQMEEQRKNKAAYMREWHKTGDGRRHLVAQGIKKRCGITIDDYDEAYDLQAGKCLICDTWRSRYGQDRLVVDHCHKSGEFRSLLCPNCNSALGLVKESVVILQSMIEYIADKCS